MLFSRLKVVYQTEMHLFLQIAQNDLGIWYSLPTSDLSWLPYEHWPFRTTTDYSRLLRKCDVKRKIGKYVTWLICINDTKTVKILWLVRQSDFLKIKRFAGFTILIIMLDVFQKLLNAFTGYYLKFTTVPDFGHSLLVTESCFLLNKKLRLKKIWYWLWIWQNKIALLQLSFQWW